MSEHVETCRSELNECSRASASQPSASRQSFSQLEQTASDSNARMTVDAKPVVDDVPPELPQPNGDDVPPELLQPKARPPRKYMANDTASSPKPDPPPDASNAVNAFRSPPEGEKPYPWRVDMQKKLSAPRLRPR